MVWDVSNTINTNCCTAKAEWTKVVCVCVRARAHAHARAFFFYDMLRYKVILHALVFMLLTTSSIWTLFRNITQVLYFALFAPPVEFFVSLADLVQFLKVN